MMNRLKRFDVLHPRLVLTCTVLITALVFACSHADGPVGNDRKPTLFIVGDSTVKNGTSGQRGWGEEITEHFDLQRITVDNRAIGGRSSRTFITEGRWDKVLADAKPGDFVLIQLGHNDAGPLDDKDRARGTIRGIGDESQEIYNPILKKREVVHTYGWYLRKYITDARQRGLTPIILSPVPRCPQEPVQLDAYEPQGYVAWSGQVAREYKATFVDLHHLILCRYAKLTPQQVKADYFTSTDNTHTNPAGAALNAVCVVQGLRDLTECSLTQYLLESP